MGEFDEQRAASRARRAAKSVALFDDWIERNYLTGNRLADKLTVRRGRNAFARIEERLGETVTDGDVWWEHIEHPAAADEVLGPYRAARNVAVAQDDFCVWRSPRTGDLAELSRWLAPLRDELAAEPLWLLLGELDIGALRCDGAAFVDHGAALIAADGSHVTATTLDFTATIVLDQEDDDDDVPGWTVTLAGERFALVSFPDG